MKNIDLFKVLSSDGKIMSVANENIVAKESPDQNAFAWKQLSLVAFADSEIVINKGEHNESTIKLIANLALELDRLAIKTLEFTTSGVEYYYVAGY